MKRGFEETSFTKAMQPQSVAAGKETACDFVDAAGAEEVMFLVVCAALDEGKKLKAALYAGESADGTGSKLVQEAEFAAEKTRGKTVMVLSYRPAPYTGYEERKAGLMAYCRIDELEPGEDALLEGLYHAAVSYMAGAGVEEPAAGSLRQALYDLCVDHLVLEAYDHRGPVEKTTENPAFRRMLNQLKMSG